MILNFKFIFLDGRIVGGKESEPHTINYQVRLKITSTQGAGQCGGSLISPSVNFTNILRAAFTLVDPYSVKKYS